MGVGVFPNWLFPEFRFWSCFGSQCNYDALTGKPVWEWRVTYTQDQYTLTKAPRIEGGKVIIGDSGRDRPTRGPFFAFDAQTGRERRDVLR